MSDFPDKTPDSGMVPIELSPYHTMVLYTFLNEHLEEAREQKILTGLRLSIEAYQEQVLKKISHGQITDAELQRQLHVALGEEPDCENTAQN